MPDNMISIVTEISEEEKKLNSIEIQRAKGDEYTYLILLNGEYKDNENLQYRDWQIVKGRQATYDMIKDLLLAQDDLDTDTIIDVSTSYIIAEPPIITENTPRLVVDDSSFCIEDYYDGE